MAALAPAQASCVVQLQLADIMGSANPVLHEIQKNGFTTALTSDINRQGFVIDAQANGSRPQDTAKRKIQVRYRSGTVIQFQVVKWYVQMRTMAKAILMLTRMFQ